MKNIDRVRQIIEEKGVSIRSFEQVIGASNGTISKAISRGGDIGSELVAKIVRAYPDINTEWLLTGNGAMLTSNIAQESPVTTSAELTDLAIRLGEQINENKHLQEKNRGLEAKIRELERLVGYEKHYNEHGRVRSTSLDALPILPTQELMVKAEPREEYK